jgi:hypothetical protein
MPSFPGAGTKQPLVLMSEKHENDMMKAFIQTL